MSSAIIRAGCWRILPFVLALTLGGCAQLRSIARDITDEIGVPMAYARGFAHLPLSRWLTRESVKPLAVAFCRKPQCLSDVAVMAVELTGADARAAQAVLDNPGSLATLMNARNAQRRREASKLTGKAAAEARVSRVTTTVERRRSGFVVTMRGRKGTAVGIVAARRDAHALRLTIAIADTREAAEQGLAHGQ